MKSRNRTTTTQHYQSLPCSKKQCSVQQCVSPCCLISTCISQEIITVYIFCRLSLHTVGDTWTEVTMAGKIWFSTFVEASLGRTGGVSKCSDVGEAVAGVSVPMTGLMFFSQWGSAQLRAQCPSCSFALWCLTCSQDRHLMLHAKEKLERFVKRYNIFMGTDCSFPSYRWSLSLIMHFYYHPHRYKDEWAGPQIVALTEDFETVIPRRHLGVSA